MTYNNQTASWLEEWSTATEERDDDAHRSYQYE